jgi:hypothetical protein
MLTAAPATAAALAEGAAETVGRGALPPVGVVPDDRVLVEMPEVPDKVWVELLREVEEVEFEPAAFKPMFRLAHAIRVLLA